MATRPHKKTNIEALQAQKRRESEREHAHVAVIACWDALAPDTAVYTSYGEALRGLKAAIEAELAIVTE